VWKIKWTLVVVLVLGSSYLLLPTTISAVDITAGFVLDKYKVVVPVYPGVERTIDIVITNITDTPSSYFVNLRAPDVIADEERRAGYSPVDVLQYEWFSYQKSVTAQGGGNATVNFNITVPSDTKLGKVDAWLDIQEDNTSSIKMNWAATILLDMYTSKEEADHHQIVYQGQNGLIIGQGGLINRGFDFYYLFLLLIVPVVIVPIVWVIRRYEMELVLLKIALEKKTFPVKVIVLDTEGYPVKGASFSVGGKSSVTDENGVALIKDVQKGSQSYIVEHSDFESKIDSIEVGKEHLVKEG
jgi:hypothetical protein